jgi:L-lactate dehydrogenase complex protein LldG
MSSREDILARVRRNQPSATTLPDVPTFDRDIASLSETFKAAFTRMGGKLAEPPRDGNLTQLVRSLFPDARVICSATPEVEGNRALDLQAPPAALDDVDVGVVRAVYGVAETGSVWITQAQFKVSALGFLSQHLVVLLDPAQIVPNLHHAYRRQTDFDTGYGAFMTGPSATADIEGVLIHGAQGIRTLTIVFVAPG